MRHASLFPVYQKFVCKKIILPLLFAGYPSKPCFIEPLTMLCLKENTQNHFRAIPWHEKVGHSNSRFLLSSLLSSLGVSRLGRGNLNFSANSSFPSKAEKIKVVVISHGLQRKKTIFSYVKPFAHNPASKLPFAYSRLSL